MERRPARRAARAHHARPDAAADRALPHVLRSPAPPGAAGPGDRPPAHRNPRAAFLPVPGGPRLSHARPPVAHALRRRGAAHQPHHRARHVAGQHAVRAGRALDRPAPARHGPGDRSDAAAARRRQLAGGGGARSADHVRRRPHPRHGTGPGRARRRGGVLRHARGIEGGPLAHRRIPFGQEARRRRRGAPAARGEGTAAATARRRRAQPEEHRRRHTAFAPGLHHRRVRLGQIDAGAGRAACGAAEGQGPADRDAGRAPRAGRRRADRRRGDGGPVADRQDHALQPGELRRRLRRDPRPVRGRARGERARLHRRHLQLQLRQRPLPDLQRQRLRARRDAVPLRRLSALPRLQRPALPRRNAGSDARGQGRQTSAVGRRRARADRGRGARVLRRSRAGAGGARAAGRRRPGIPQARPAGAHALRRRSAAAEARRASGRGDQGRTSRRRAAAQGKAVPVRRAHHRPALRRHRQAAAARCASSSPPGIRWW